MSEDGKADGGATGNVTAARRRALLEHAREALFSTELDGSILDVNSAAAAALGIDVSLAQPEALLLCVAPADAPGVRRVLETIAQSSSAELELHLRSPRGRELWAVRATFGREAHAVLWSAATNGEKEMTGLRRLVLDKTELLDRERARSAMSEAAGHAKDRLLAIVAEDTSATLNSVLGWTRMLRAEVLDRAARDMVLAVVEGSVERHLALLAELLEVAQIVDGNVAFDLERIDLGLLVEHALSTAASAAADRGVTVRSASECIDADLSTVGDRGKLARLVSAAIESFVDRASRGDEIVVDMLRDEASFVLRVRASGARLSSNASRATSTFSLLLVDRIARMHGGGATRSSERDGSSWLEVRLPIAHEARLEFAPTSPQPLHGMRVLVFAPDHDLRELAKMQLRHHGASVLSARDAMTASAAVASFRPHVVVADIDHDGDRLLDELATQEAAASYALVGLTASEVTLGRESEPSHARSRVVLPMPLDTGRLLEAVERSRAPRRPARARVGAVAA